MLHSTLQFSVLKLIMVWLVGSYCEKLKHFAQSIQINTDVLILSPYYIEAAIYHRIISFLNQRRLSPMGPGLHTPLSPAAILNSPKLFVECFIRPEQWGALFDKEHFFDFIDTNDKKFVLNFLWIILTLHHLRKCLMKETSIAVVGAKKAGKGATLNALFGIGTKSGFSQAYTTKEVECFR